MKTNRDVLDRLEQLDKRDKDRGGTRVAALEVEVSDGTATHKLPGPEALALLREMPEEGLDAPWPTAQATDTPDPEPETTEPEPATPEEPSAETETEPETVAAEAKEAAAEKG